MNDTNSPQEGFENSYASNPAGPEEAAPLSSSTTDEGPQPPVASRQSVFKTIARYATIWLAVFLVLKFVVPSYEVKGSSMEPTYDVAGDRVLTDQVFFKLGGGPARGDIVVLSRPAHEGEDPLIKRVIGLPGDKVEVRRGTVYVNDKALDEPYIKNTGDYNYGPIVVEKDCYFVLGDNRPVSLDSHYFGCVSKDHILAKVLFRYPHLFK